MLEKCVLTILELNWNQHLRHKRTKFNICHHMLASSKQLQNRSFHVEERTRTSSKCQKMKNACAKCAKILFFIAKYANLWGFCCCRCRGCLSALMSFNIITPCNNSSFMSFKVWFHEHQLKLDLAQTILLPLPTHLQNLIEKPEGRS